LTQFELLLSSIASAGAAGPAATVLADFLAQTNQ